MALRVLHSDQAAALVQPLPRDAARRESQPAANFAAWSDASFAARALSPDVPSSVQAASGVLPEPSRAVAAFSAPARASSSGGGASEPALESEILRLKQALAELRQDAAAIRDAESRTAGVMQEQMQTAAAALRDVIEAFLGQTEQVRAEGEKLALRVAVAVARRIVGDTARVREDVVRRTLAAALEHVHAGTELVVVLHPEDMDLVREQQHKWLLGIEKARSVRFQVDAQVGRGGCRLESSSGNVDAAIEAQLAALQEALIAEDT